MRKRYLGATYQLKLELISTDIIASFVSSTEDNLKTYDVLISIFLIMPDYALSHALNVLLITYVKQREQQYNLNLGNFIYFYEQK